MKHERIFRNSVFSAFGVFIYTIAVGWLMFNGERIFGSMNFFLGPALLLMLFVLSAAVVVMLVFGRPV